ncbi:MAG: hypothetical protein ABFS02_07010 [Pseudomonadota bacterium]
MSTIRKKVANRVAVSALLVAAWSLGPTLPSVAATDLAACAGVVGTYVTTITDKEGVFASRGLMTFTSDGLLLVSDSAQGGVPGVWDPFSPMQGAWKCVEAGSDKLSINAVGLNFVLPSDGRTSSFGRVEYQASLDIKTGMLSGSATLRFASGNDLEGIDPIDQPGSVLDEFQFDGKRLMINK